jgi:hypothetical protein
MKTISITKQRITPEMAVAFLNKSKLNRRLSDRNVESLYLQMKGGNWMLTGDPIKFCTDGSLLDGQHRLKAIIKYGSPVDLFVAEGLPAEVFQVLDTGKSRSAADVLSASGMKYSHNIAAIARAIILWKNGVYAKNSGDGKLKATNKAILEFVESTPEIHEVSAYCQNHIYQNFRPIPLSTLAMLYFILSKKNQTKTDEFFEKYASGIDLSKTNPILHLRERLIKDKANKSRLNLRDKTALMIYTWNNFIQNKQVTQLLLPRDYQFPKPI